MSRNRYRSSWCGPWLDTTHCCSAAAVKRMCAIIRNERIDPDRMPLSLSRNLSSALSWTATDCAHICRRQHIRANDLERYIVIFLLAHTLIYLLLSHVPYSVEFLRSPPACDQHAQTRGKIHATIHEEGETAPTNINFPWQAHGAVCACRGVKGVNVGWRWLQMKRIFMISNGIPLDQLHVLSDCTCR